MDVLTWIILAVVAVVVLLAVAFIAVRAARRRSDQRRAEAQSLRAEAAAGSSAAAETQRQAQQAEQQAARARAEAEHAEQQAEAARQQALVDQARVEDRVREADRLDPDVDTRSGDYTPEPPPAGPATTDALGRTEAGTLPDHPVAERAHAATHDGAGQVPPDEPGTHRA
jgi:hypothetical protein